jgi:hypothetical protein
VAYLMLLSRHSSRKTGKILNTSVVDDISPGAFTASELDVV